MKNELLLGFTRENNNLKIIQPDKKREKTYQKELCRIIQQHIKTLVAKVVAYFLSILETLKALSIYLPYYNHIISYVFQR